MSRHFFSLADTGVTMVMGASRHWKESLSEPWALAFENRFPTQSGPFPFYLLRSLKGLELGCHSEWNGVLPFDSKCILDFSRTLSRRDLDCTVRTIER
jgi:hypothetical protein